MCCSHPCMKCCYYVRYVLARHEGCKAWPAIRLWLDCAKDSCLLCRIESCVKVSLVQAMLQNSLNHTTASVTKNHVLTSDCHASEVPLESECNAWFSVALSLHRDCPYLQGLLYQLFDLYFCYRGFLFMCRVPGQATSVPGRGMSPHPPGVTWGPMLAPTLPLTPDMPGWCIS